MDVSYVQLSSKAPRGDEVMAGAEGADLGPPIGAHGRAQLPSATREAVAVQHLGRNTGT